MRSNCGVNVTVAGWSEAQWVDYAAVVGAVQVAVANSWSLGLESEEIEDDLLAVYGEYFGEACIEFATACGEVDAEIQVTLLTHAAAAPA